MSLLRLAHNSVDSNKVEFTARRAETAMGAFQHRRGDTGADVGLAVVYLALRSSGPASSELLPNEHRRAAHNKRTAAGEHGSDPEPTGFLSPRLCCPLTGDEWWKENAILGGLPLCTQQQPWRTRMNFATPFIA